MLQQTVQNTVGWSAVKIFMWLIGSQINRELIVGWFTMTLQRIFDTGVFRVFVVILEVIRSYSLVEKLMWMTVLSHHMSLLILVKRDKTGHWKPIYCCLASWNNLEWNHSRSEYSLELLYAWKFRVKLVISPISKTWLVVFLEHENALIMRMLVLCLFLCMSAVVTFSAGITRLLSATVFMITSQLLYSLYISADLPKTLQLYFNIWTTQRPVYFRLGSISA